MTSSDHALDSTASLLALVRRGELAARDRLFHRFFPVLQRWAHGRLPASARGLADTDDVVQVTLIRAFNRIGEFESQGNGAFLAYLRQILLNQIRDEIRRARRKPQLAEQQEDIADPSPSPLEQAIGAETLARYERALSRMSKAHQLAVTLRVEWGFSYQEMAEILDRPSANAARLLVTRALVRLAKEMDARV